MNFYEVFTPGGVPTYTYNPRDSYDLEMRIMKAKRNLCKLMIVTGQTKMGKTVLAEKVYSRGNNSIWVDGGGISDEGSFWDNIVSQLSLPTEYANQNTSDSNYSIEAGAEGQLRFCFLDMKPQGSVKIEHDRLKGMTSTSKMSNKMASIKYLTDNNIPLIVDDFHYIKRDVQTQIVRALKSPIMHGLPVIFIAIPSRKFDVLKVEREMTGRIEMIEIPMWSDEELMEIAEKGFKELHVEVPFSVIMKMAKEAMGSPHLMQEFCKKICEEHKIEKRSLREIKLQEDIPLSAIFREIAKISGRELFEKLARGPRQRSDRIHRQLKNGNQTDIYGVVMEGLKSMKPGVSSINYEEFRGCLKEIIDDVPQLHEISRVLEKIAEISYNSGASTPVIDWDKDEAILTVTDPFFAFYLRWCSE